MKLGCQMNMEKIICNVLIFTIITSVLKGLIIKDEYKQYFQFFCGLIMILIVITPFIDFLSSDNDYYDILQKNIYSLEIKDSIGSIKTADGKMRDVLVRQCESKIEGQIKKMAQKDGVDCNSVDVETKMSDEELEIVMVNVSMKDGAVAAYSDISGSRDKLDKNEKRLKNDICDSYMLDGGKVKIWK